MRLWSLDGHVPRAASALIAATVLASSLALALTPVPTAAAGLAPRDIITTDDEAGKQASRNRDKDGEDARSTWAQIRWERDRESPDATTGPVVVESTVFVAKDHVSARAIYQEQKELNKNFPEAFEAHRGPHELGLPPLGDESSGLSSCEDCNAKDGINLHHRVSFRRGGVVVTLYLFGSDETAPPGLVGWYAMQTLGRIPDAAMQIPERAGGEPAQASAPAAGGGAPSGSAPTDATAPAAASSADLVTARPKDLAVKLDEAGKRAEVKKQSDGTDDRGTWYEVRYERGGSGGRFYEGPVTVFNRVFVAKDVETAKKVFAEASAQSEKFPEATERVGDRFELKEANEVGQEGKGVSACDRSCNSDKDTYVHKRLVTRHGNVVSVVYLWGMSHPEGTTDWHARYFAGLVMQRARGE